MLNPLEPTDWDRPCPHCGARPGDYEWADEDQRIEPPTDPGIINDMRFGSDSEDPYLWYGDDWDDWPER